MIYNEQPEDFVPDIEVVGCLIECESKILLLHRHDNKTEGNKWGLPGGKVDKGDKDEKEAMLRELKEETGLSVEEDGLSYYRTFFVSHREYNYFYHYFNYQLEELPSILISENEHKAYRWLTPEEALSLPLVLDEEHCLRDYYGIE